MPQHFVLIVQDLNTIAHMLHLTWNNLNHVIFILPVYFYLLLEYIGLLFTLYFSFLHNQILNFCIDVSKCVIEFFLFLFQLFSFLFCCIHKLQIIRMFGAIMTYIIFPYSLQLLFNFRNFISKLIVFIQ